MSKKAKSEVTDNSADTVMDGVLSENQAKLNKLNSSIQAAYERRRKIITDSKLYTYDKLSQLYGGAEGQALLDAVTAEHTLIGKLTDSLVTLRYPQCFSSSNAALIAVSFSLQIAVRPEIE